MVVGREVQPQLASPCEQGRGARPLIVEDRPDVPEARRMEIGQALERTQQFFSMRARRCAAVCQRQRIGHRPRCVQPLVLCAALAALVLIGGCATIVSCPPVDGPSRIALLLDHGQHASLAVEAAHGALLRYSYGDQRWYAQRDTGFASGFDALVRTTPAVLSRHELQAAPNAPAIAVALGLLVEEALAFPVHAQRADALIERLDTIWFSDPRASVYAFAAHPQPYSLQRNSNQMVAEWLRELDCTVSDDPLLSNWRAR